MTGRACAATHIPILANDQLRLLRDVSDSSSLLAIPFQNLLLFSLARPAPATRFITSQNATDGALRLAFGAVLLTWFVDWFVASFAFGYVFLLSYPRLVRGSISSLIETNHTEAFSHKVIDRVAHKTVLSFLLSIRKMRRVEGLIQLNIMVLHQTRLTNHMIRSFRLTNFTDHTTVPLNHGVLYCVNHSACFALPLVLFQVDLTLI